MNRMQINGCMSVPCPEGFEAMSAEELRQVYVSEETNRQGMWDRDRHVMVTALWQRYNPLLVRLADMKALARRNEQLTRRGYEGHDYRLEGFFSTEAGGRAAEGYRFTYRLGDVEQRVETVLIRKGSTIYSLNCIGRAVNRDENRALFESILKGIAEE